MGGVRDHAAPPVRRIRGEVFEQMLAERGLSMTEFHQQSGIARSTLERARRGEPLTTNTLRRISDTLDRIPVSATVLRLLGRDGGDSPAPTGGGDS
jgi:DNA-binding Xre family transcriptional regulator